MLLHPRSAGALFSSQRVGVGAWVARPVLGQAWESPVQRVVLASWRAAQVALMG